MLSSCLRVVNRMCSCCVQGAVHRSGDTLMHTQQLTQKVEMAGVV